jgi:hypothetical protein
MSLGENTVMVRRFIEARNERSLDLLDDLGASDHVDHIWHPGGLERLKQGLQLGFQGFPGWHDS